MHEGAVAGSKAVVVRLRRRGSEYPPLAMSGRQYNMYNSQTAEAWKQRVMKENLHNAPSLRVFADLADDDDNQSVSSMGSRATGMTRASVATSRASVASTAALNRVRSLTPLPERTHSPPQHAPTFATPVTRSSARLTSTCRAPVPSCIQTARYTACACAACTVAAHHPLCRLAVGVPLPAYP